MFKKVLEEIDTLERYRSIASNSEFSSSDLEQRAKKILSKIPTNLHKYVDQAISDFYKQVEEYEVWKQKTAGNYLYGPNADLVLISMILPEFNMEKNMPVEDDDNLEKKEEW